MSATVTDQFKIRFDYTTTHTRDETTDLELLRRPGKKASVTAVWTPLIELTIAATLVHVEFLDRCEPRQRQCSFKSA